jgi:energy-converting hydrogenase Eha subunit E
MNKEKVNEIIQWVGAVFIILGHVFNAIGPAVYPYNIVVFTVGTIAFLAWAYRTKNTAQTVVNVVSIAICIMGLYGAIFN